MPRLLRKVPRRHARPSGPKRATQCHECHVCRAKQRWMRDFATPATRNQGGCHQVPRQPRKVAVTRPSAPPSAMSATPATQNDRGCEILPRLPRETTGGCHQVPRLPRKDAAALRATKCATQCHDRGACHAKRPWM